MVLNDFYLAEKKEKNSPPAKVRLAPPSDRLLASFFDFLFHAPFFTFVSFIILYRLNLLKLTISATSEKMAVLAQLLWIIIIGSIILQSIYLKLMKKTPGMRLMKLEIRTLSSGELSWGQCFLRSVTWCLQVLCMGIPFLSIFSHPKRHALHDRISETEMITLKTTGALAPLPAEKAMVQVVFTCVVMLSLGWLTAMFSLTQRGIQEGSLAISEWRERGQLCSQIDEVSSYSTVDLTPLKTRLDFSIGLFLFDQIDADCFKKEVDFALVKEVPGALIWVGQALLTAQYTPERQGYLNKACEEDARWCQKSLLQEKGSIEEAKEILKMATGTKKSEEDSLAYDAAKLILLNRLGAVTEAAQLIEKLQNRGIRATGLVAEHLKVVSRSHPEELPAVLDTLKSVMVEKDYMRLNSEICLRQLETGCGSKVRECETLQSILPKYKESLSDLVVSRALFKSSLCNKNLAENMEYWTLISHEGLQKLIPLAQQLDQVATQSQGLSKIRHFINDEAQNLELRFDALQLLLSRSHYPEDWKLVSSLWSHFNWTQSLYLSASEWLLREGSKNNQNELVLSMSRTFSVIPGLKFNWSLFEQKLNERLPASSATGKKQ